MLSCLDSEHYGVLSFSPHLFVCICTAWFKMERIWNRTVFESFKIFFRINYRGMMTPHGLQGTQGLLMLQGTQGLLICVVQNKQTQPINTYPFNMDHCFLLSKANFVSSNHTSLSLCPPGTRSINEDRASISQLPEHKGKFGYSRSVLGHCPSLHSQSCSVPFGTGFYIVFSQTSDQPTHWWRLCLFSSCLDQKAV